MNDTPLAAIGVTMPPLTDSEDEAYTVPGIWTAANRSYVDDAHV